MKKAIRFCLILSVVMCICACGKKPEKENVAGSGQETSEIESTLAEIHSTEEITTIDEFLILPDEEKIMEDINRFEETTFVINTGSYKLETKDVEIEKASQDNKKYTIYCYATQENENYKADNYYLLVYNYYDIGGWILDECTIQEKNIVSLNACEMEFARNNLQTEFSLTQCDYENVEKVSETEYVYYFKGKREYNYLVESFDLLVYCFFDQEYGWSFYNDYTYYSEDWSRMYGTWYGKGVYASEYTGVECTVEVISVDYINNTVKMNIKIVSPWKNSIPTEVIANKEYIKSNSIDYEWGHYHLLGKVLYEDYEGYMSIYYDEYKGIGVVRYNGDTFYMNKIN